MSIVGLRGGGERELIDLTGHGSPHLTLVHTTCFAKRKYYLYHFTSLSFIIRLCWLELGLSHEEPCKRALAIKIILICMCNKNPNKA